MEKSSLEQEDLEALAALPPEPLPPRKSYSQQIRNNTVGFCKRQHQARNHSLDQDFIIHPNGIDKFSDHNGFHPYSISGGGAAINASPIIGGSNRYEYRIEHSVSGDNVVKAGSNALPEFVANGGTGIFKVPTRAAVHPGRPTCIELRPHPLRETQVGKFLRTIACTETQLWAGQESGVRVWNISDAYEPGLGIGGRARRGDEAASPFYESVTTSPTICLVIDSGSKLVWSGHKDGKIRSWKTDQVPMDASSFKEGLSWQAHRGSVLSMTISSHGDIWSGSEGGIIKIWPWEAIEKSLSLSSEERHMAGLLVERSGIDLRSQVTVNGVCNISSSDVKSLLSDTVRSKIWAASSLSFSLWDARTRELLKVYNVEGNVENRVDMPSPTQEQPPPLEDEMNVKFVTKSKKEKSQGGFLQRSRNAIMGAADAVRRVATKGTGAFVEDAAKRTEALVMTSDGTIWSGCTNGLLVKWDGNGNRLNDFQHHPCAVQCFCTTGVRVWVGYVSGVVQLLDLEGNLCASWVAHNGPVIKLVVGSSFVFSLASHGGIRGWNIASPGPMDSILRLEVAAKDELYTSEESIRILIGTWNVAQGRASHEALMTWLGSAVSDVGIVVVGCQEVEMGAGFLAMSAAKETVGLEGSSTGQWWQDAIGKALEEGTTFERVGSRQLAALLIAIWVRKSLRTHVGDLDVAAVACGLGRAIGNKGGVGLRLRVYDRIMCFVNCHLAAHLEAVNRRNADFDHIYRTMVFTRPSHLSNTTPSGVSTAVQMARGTNSQGIVQEEVRPDLGEADLVIFLGDFNYRLFGISYDEARDFVSQRTFDWLREKDQLRAEMKAGKVFQGMHEALIKFPPTYKFEKGKPGLGGYDSGEKKRIPAWCDRILYRDNRPSSTAECGLECPVVASILKYEACMEVTESDHKPVRCKLNVEISNVDRSVRRRESGYIVKNNQEIISLLEAMKSVPETIVDTTNITIQNQDAFTLKITNKSGNDHAAFQFFCEGLSIVKGDNDKEPDYRPRASYGFPRWLQVMPATGLIGPDQTVEISIAHEEPHEEQGDGVPQSWWSEDNRDKELILLIIVRGGCSSESKSHRINVRHSFTIKPTRIDSKNSSSRRKQ